MIFFLLPVVLSAFHVLAPDDQSGSLSSGLRTQRDISSHIPLPLENPWGVDLNKLVFSHMGYTSSALDQVSSILQQGTQTYMVDVFWNEYTEKWQLCPAPFGANNTDESGNLVWGNSTYTCSLGVAVYDLMHRFVQYSLSSNTNVEANFLQILLNLRRIENRGGIVTNAAALAHGNATLYDCFSEADTFTFGPSDLAAFRNGNISAEVTEYYVGNGGGGDSQTVFPSWDSLELKRLIINAVTNEVPSNGTYQFSPQDALIMFSSQVGRMENIPTDLYNSDNTTLYSNCIEMLTSEYSQETYHRLSTTDNFRFVLDKGFSNETFHNYVKCGMAPIIGNVQKSMIVNTISDKSTTTESTKSALTDVSTFFVPTVSTTASNVFASSSVPAYTDSPTDYNYTTFISTLGSYSYWSWAPGQPLIPGNDTAADSDNSDTANVAYQCIALLSDGWHVANCYNEYAFACQNISTPNEWIISDERKTYFEVYKNSCPPGYNFSVPRSWVENLSLLARVRAQNVSRPVWIDLNDITVSGCFVSGGPYAQCPYQRTVTPRTLVKMLAPGIVVVIVLLVSIGIEKFTWHPIQTNRRAWKKKLARHNRDDYEGVPS